MFLTEDRQHVRWLTIDRPAQKNAIPPEGWAQLADAFDEFETSDQRVLVVTGSGEDFCSGADLGEGAMASDVVAQRARMKQVGAAALALHRMSKPSIAAVDGVAVGAGMNLALGCDVVVATDRARFAEIFVRRGLTVDFGGTWLLPRVVGLQRAKELALSGRIVPAAEAKELGLVLDVVGVEALADRAMELAESFAAQAPVGQMMAKHALNVSFESSMAEALVREEQGQIMCLHTEDVVEGVAAFLEKRPPLFRGR